MYINVKNSFSILLYMHFLNTHSQWQCCYFQTHILNGSAAISRSWGLLCILGLFAFFVFLFCHPIGGRDCLKKRKIHEETSTWKRGVNPAIGCVPLIRNASDCCPKSPNIMISYWYFILFHEPRSGVSYLLMCTFNSHRCRLFLQKSKYDDVLLIFYSFSTGTSREVGCQPRYRGQCVPLIRNQSDCCPKSPNVLLIFYWYLICFFRTGTE